MTARIRPTAEDQRKARALELLDAHPNQFYHTLDGAYEVYAVVSRNLDRGGEPDGLSAKPVAVCIGLESVATELRLLHSNDKATPAPAAEPARPSASDSRVSGGQDG